ncbi:hypothetical protein B9Z55_021230 [Caenorhabditis nigoni]|nr:hypothetical protein B9Z55_021230 [Caenorhabditis nigoni]
MSQRRSYPAISGRILVHVLEEVQMPSCSGQSTEVIGQHQEIHSSDPGFGKGNEVVHQVSSSQAVLKDSDTLITCPQDAKNNYTAKYSYRAKHNYKDQFSTKESRSRPYLSRKVNLNAFGTE